MNKKIGSLIVLLIVFLITICYFFITWYDARREATVGRVLIAPPNETVYKIVKITPIEATPMNSLVLHTVEEDFFSILTNYTAVSFKEQGLSIGDQVTRRKIIITTEGGRSIQIWDVRKIE